MLFKKKNQSLRSTALLQLRFSDIHLAKGGMRERERERESLVYFNIYTVSTGMDYLVRGLTCDCMERELHGNQAECNCIPLRWLAEKDRKFSMW